VSLHANVRFPRATAADWRSSVATWRGRPLPRSDSPALKTAGFSTG
jgi:hypothetical protein